MSTAPPGWYPDPSAPQSGQVWLRWWDGYVWTDHVAPGPQGALTAQGPTAPDGVPLAGWWWRVLAYVIDGFVLAIPNTLLTLPAQLSMQRDLQDIFRELEASSSTGSPPDVGTFFGDYLEVFRSHALGLLLPGLLLFLAYFAIMWRWRGATLGQRIAGLQVRPLAGPGRPTWPMAIVRSLVLYVLPTALMLFGLLSGSWPVGLSAYGLAFLLQLLNVLWPLWDRRRQALHDKAARTVVVRPRR